MIKYILVSNLVLIVVLIVALYFFPVIQICGNSMHPTLLDGEIYIGRRVFRKSKCKVGEIYVYKPPCDKDREEKYVIKRLAGVSKTLDGKKTLYYFLGDNARESYDSRYYGYVNSRNVVAQLIVLRKEV